VADGLGSFGVFGGRLGDGARLTLFYLISFDQL